MSKSEARFSILSELLAFPTVNQKDWVGAHSYDGDKARIGDLVSLSCARASKWYVSWIIDIEIVSRGYVKYLLESIEDGSLCWWENVGLNVYSRERTKVRPEWKWTDKQFAFYGRWSKVGRKNNAYLILPCQPEFKEDDSVILDVRIRFGWSDYRNKKIFPNWKKLTMKQMDEYYKECEAEYNNLKKVG
ncbi:MAG: hypothetical protein V3R78_10295 [Thermodesulfobacteriota bacterium]